MTINPKAVIAQRTGFRTPSPRDEAERYRLAIEAIDDGVWDWDVKAGQIYCSPAYFGMLGYPAVAAIRRYEDWLAEVHPDDRAEAGAVAAACFEGRVERFSVEFRMRKADGTWLWVLGRGRAVESDEAGRCLRMIGTHVDISARKSNEATIRSLAAQKAFLLKELQHRVKNSLALLQSMLQLQSSRYPDGSEAHKALANAALRVQGLATLYTRLYAEGRAAVLDTRSFLSDLLHALEAGAEDAVCIEADLCRAEMSLGLLSPLGIMAAELVTNAMKHAAGSAKAARVKVRTRCAEGRFELLVYDDGPGLPEAAAAALRGEAPEGAGFGLFMVRALADQVGAEIEATAGSSEICVSLAAPATTSAERAEEPYPTPA